MRKVTKLLLMFTMVFSIFFIGLKSESYAGASNIIGPETDRASYILVSVFDLRDRESFVQVTNTSSSAVTTHVQIFAVNDDCRENNFFDTYTGNDSHVYNMRDILTNDGNPSGVVLNDGEYGMVVVTTFLNGTIDIDQDLIGNFRIIDDLGYEYRTNSAGSSQSQIPFEPSQTFTANFNTLGGVTLSDIFSVALSDVGTESAGVTADPIETFGVINFDIFNLDEVPFSCPNFIFACIDQDSPRLEELLETAAEATAGASLASFELGINDAIPSSKGAPIACPSNIISEGFTRSTFIGGQTIGRLFFADAFVGLNNGNGRGSMDQLWGGNIYVFQQGG